MDCRPNCRNTFVKLSFQFFPAFSVFPGTLSKIKASAAQLIHVINDVN